VKDRHEDDVKTYKMFCEYLEPGSLKEKLSGAIKKLERETIRLKLPVEDLKKIRDHAIAKRDRKLIEVEELEKKNASLR